MAEPKAARPMSKSSSSLADSSKATDFVEIFGGLEASCSIPFLELPVGFEDTDDARGGERRFVENYEEIFGGVGGLNLGISCEEMQRPDDLDGRCDFLSWIYYLFLGFGWCLNLGFFER